MSDEQKPPKGFRWVEVGEVLQDGDRVFTDTGESGVQLYKLSKHCYIRPIKSGDKPVTQKWLGRHLKCCWDFGALRVQVDMIEGYAVLLFSSRGVTFHKVPIENRRHLKRFLKALDLPFEKVP